MRPSTDAEKRIGELETGLYKARKALQEIEWAINRFKEMGSKQF